MKAECNWTIKIPQLRRYRTHESLASINGSHQDWISIVKMQERVLVAFTMLKIKITNAAMLITNDWDKIFKDIFWAYYIAIV